MPIFPISKIMLGAVGVVGVSATGAGIYTLASHSSKKEEPKCRIFFADNSGTNFSEMSIKDLKNKSYTNGTKLLEDINTACDGTNPTEKPKYKNRVYVKQGSDANTGVYSKDDQNTFGEKHDSQIKY